MDSPIGVVGAGTMGAGIAQIAAVAGHPTILIGTPPETLVAARNSLAKALDILIAKGRLPPTERAATLARLTTAGEMAALAPARLVIEAVPEDMAIKHVVLREIEAVVAPDSIIASNTSALSIAAMGRALARPERLIGLHFFNPAPLLPLVEVIAAPLSDPSVVDAGFATMQAWGKTPVRCRSTPGFIVNRCARAFYAEALRSLVEQATNPATLDAVMRDAGGFRMGPCELMDLIGHDINVATTATMSAAMFGDPRYRGSPLQKEMVEAGLLGRKTGCGFFSYATNAECPAPDDAPVGPTPSRVLMAGAIGSVASFGARARAAGLAVECGDGDGRLIIDGVHLAPTDGRPASLRSDVDALFDLCLDPDKAPRIAFAVGDRAAAGVVATIAGFFRALGLLANRIDDIPGLLVARVVATLANEALDAAHQGIASEADIDLAMVRGVNYPIGPITWASRIGFGRTLAIMENLQRVTGDDRYRPCVRLRRRAAAEGAP